MIFVESARASQRKRKSSSSYSSVCLPLNDRPDLLCHTSVSQLKTSLVRFHSLSLLSPVISLILCLLSAPVGPFHYLKMIKVGQIGLNLRHVAQKER